MQTIRINPQTNHMLHAYVVKNAQTQETVFTGVDVLKNIVTLQKISNLAEFDNRYEYDIEIMGPFHQEGHARNAIHYHYGNICPKLNIIAGQSGRYVRNRLIYCNETGQVFLSQVEAAKHFNINQANISRHLKKYPGFASCKGYTFKFLNHDEGQSLQKAGLLIDKNGKKL